MTQKEAENIFCEKDAAPLLKRYLQCLEQYQIEHREEIVGSMKKSLQMTLEELERRRFSASFIVYTLLRTELMEGRGRYLIKAYDKNWYFGETVDLYWYGADWGFRFFYSFWEAAVRESRKYIGRVTEAFVRNMAMETALEFHRQMTAGFKKDGAALFELEEWAGLVTKPELYLGEYMGKVWSLEGDD